MYNFIHNKDGSLPCVMKLRSTFFCYDWKIISAERVCQLDCWKGWAHKHSIICILCGYIPSFENLLSYKLSKLSTKNLIIFNLYICSTVSVWKPDKSGFRTLVNCPVLKCPDCKQLSDIQTKMSGFWTSVPQPHCESKSRAISIKKCPSVFLSA